MKFLLVSRHTGGREVPEKESEQLIKDLKEWLALLNASRALPVHGGKSITSQITEEYRAAGRGNRADRLQSVESGWSNSGYIHSCITHSLKKGISPASAYTLLTLLSKANGNSMISK